MKNDSLGDRMKAYEGIPQLQLMRRTPVVIRIDGKAFHTFTRGLDKPYDLALNEAMASTMHALCGSIQGAVFGYTQSDEISILLQDWATLTTERWFDYKVQKMVSVVASMTTAIFNSIYTHPKKGQHMALFDARAFNVPFEEVTNMFLWRQQDAVRNSIQGLAQANFSHKEMHGLSCSELQDKLMLEKGINWNDTATRFKRGVCSRLEFIPGTDTSDMNFKWELDFECPIFTQDRSYVESALKIYNNIK